jgi:hypothetical protein
MSNSKLIRVGGGRVTMIYSDDDAQLLAQGRCSVTRASHVEPAEGGGWTADMTPVGGPILGPFTLRSEALDKEVLWLNENVLQSSSK